MNFINYGDADQTFPFINLDEVIGIVPYTTEEAQGARLSNTAVIKFFCKNDSWYIWQFENDEQLITAIKFLKRRLHVLDI